MKPTAESGRILTLPPERRPPARRLCTNPNKKRRAGGRRSTTRFSRWWQCQDAPLKLLVVVVGLCALSFSPADSGAAGQGVSSDSPSRFIIGISPFLDKSVKDEVYRAIVRLVVEDLPLNSALSIYDAFELKTIAQFSLPDARAFNSPKTRANQFAPAIRGLKLFLAEERHRPTIVHSSFEGAIRLPQFLDFLDGTRTTHSNTSVLLIGSPLY